VVDFDSGALESLLEFDSMAKSRGLEFVLNNPSDLLSVALSITGLDEKLEIRREEQEKV
jgi:anti-anti-sigma regulatory factor